MNIVSSIDYVRLTLSKIIISVFAQVARLIVIKKIRDLHPRFRRTLTTTLTQLICDVRLYFHRRYARLGQTHGLDLLWNLSNRP